MSDLEQLRDHARSMAEAQHADEIDVYLVADDDSEGLF